MLTRLPILFLLTGLLQFMEAKPGEPIIATFSIVARDPTTGELGVAVQSKFIAVGSAVPFAEAGVGAIASQAWGNVRYGPVGLAMLKEGKTPEEVTRLMTNAIPDGPSGKLGSSV
jgi:uncharacterized Ntn-hydrolase superfamily protein